jgi:hypothetical protein
MVVGRSSVNARGVGIFSVKRLWVRLACQTEPIAQQPAREHQHRD